MALLVRTPAPFATESLFGFLLRVSESNGYESPKDILQVAEVERGKAQILPGLPIEGIARILGRDFGELSRIAHKSSESDSWSFKILHHDMGRDLNGALRLRRPAFCLPCVRELGYIDAFWDLSTAVACPKHRCKVLRNCCECGSPIRWFRPGLLTCHCGASLSDASCDGAELTTVALMDLLQEKLHGRSVTMLPNAIGFPLEALERLSLKALVQVLKVLGSHSLCGSHDSEEHVIAAAADALAQWPAGYHRFLTQFGTRTLSEAPSAFGFRKQFAPFYGAMFKSRSLAGSADFFREEFIKFGLRHWGHAALEGKLLRSSARSAQRFVSKTQFARKFGIWKPTMERMIADGTVVTRTLGKGNTRRVVVDVETSRLPVESAGVIAAREAAAHLGLPVSVLQHLRNTGVLATQPRRGHKRSWHRDDVEQFLIRGISLPYVSAGATGTVQLSDVMRLKLRDAKAKADIVAAMFDGRLAVAGRVGQKLGGLCLNREQLEAFVSRKRIEVEGDTCSFPEAGARTGLEMSVVADAIASRLLTAVEVDRRKRVTCSSIERFNANYIPMSQLAKQLKASSGSLLRICRRVGISVIRLSRTGGRPAQPILPRTSLLELTESREAELDSRRRKSKKYRESACKAAMHTYLQGLRAQGNPLPRFGAQPNKIAIARACGFSRHVLYSYAHVVQMLEDFERAERRGTKGILAPLAALEDYLNGLRDSGTPLPSGKRNQPNKRAIAEACGIDRKVLYRNPAAALLLQTHALRSDPNVSRIACA